MLEISQNIMAFSEYMSFTYSWLFIIITSTKLVTLSCWTCLPKFLTHKSKISKLMWVIFTNLKEFLVFWNKLDFFLLQHTISLIYATFSLLFKTLIECQIEIVPLFHFELNYETSNSNSKIILLNLVCSTGQS